MQGAQELVIYDGQATRLLALWLAVASPDGDAFRQRTAILAFAWSHTTIENFTQVDRLLLAALG
ncbi:hypothetical protein CFAM422_007268 [Trichoderma lentiforme]|jgi:hypothetical protein|uniref:Uncharacterized protein n=1 Tax=Trichoderma lentiforme TaxID=1567552 RepID=A0A9P5CB65_9HYPO|nr:hypothetical protein CFAM422_007268 [Trichoderma lentiforme]